MPGPVHLPPARWLQALLLGLSVLFLVRLGLRTLWDDAEVSPPALAALLAVHATLWFRTLRLSVDTDAAGIRSRDLFVTRRIPWADVSRIALTSPPRSGALPGIAVVRSNGSLVVLAQVVAGRLGPPAPVVAEMAAALAARGGVELAAAPVRAPKQPVVGLLAGVALAVLVILTGTAVRQRHPDEVDVRLPLVVDDCLQADVFLEVRTAVACAPPASRIAAAGPMTGTFAAYPGRSLLERGGAAFCPVGTSVAVPSAEQWALGDRAVYCVVAVTTSGG